MAIKKLLWYSVDKVETGGDGERLGMVLKDNLNKNEGSKVMKSLADKWMEEGVEKERFVIAQKMLSKNRPEQEIAEFTDLTIEQINKLKNKSYKFQKIRKT